MTDLASTLRAVVEARKAATPGPWKRYREQFRPTSKMVAIEVQAAGWPPIVQWSGFDDSSRPKAEHGANAQFIAKCANWFLAHGEAAAAALERLPKLEAALDKALSGTFNDCTLHGPHEHAFRGPHYFREWDPADYPQYGRPSAGDKAEAPHDPIRGHGSQDYWNGPPDE